MSYQYEEILRDAKGNPIPQYYDQSKERFEPLTEKFGEVDFGDIVFPDNPTEIKINNLPEVQDVKDIATTTAVGKVETAIKEQSFVIPEADYTEILTELANVKAELKSTNDKLDGTINANLTGSYVGYSTDDKTVIEASEGDDFLELDTKDIYIYDGVEWVVF